MGEPVTEADLQAFIDGQLDMPGRIEVERWLQSHPEAAAEVMEGLRLRDEIRLYLASDGWVPAPASVGRCRELARHLASRRAGQRLRRMVAAALLVGAGWFSYAELGLFVDPVAAAHPVPAFAAEAARSLDTLATKLGTGEPSRSAPIALDAPRTGGEVPIPALGGSAQLVGSDLVRWEGGTGMVALFRTEGGELISLFAAEAPGFDVVWPRTARVRGHATVFWQTGPFAYALSGGPSEDVLLDLARKAAPRPWASFVRSPATEGAPHG
jgi:anti-sigma factor RsiW